MMKKPILTFLLLIPLFLAKAQNPNPNPELDAFILDEMENEKIPGMSTLIVKDGEIVWIESYGLADVENAASVTDSTVFLLASISKIVTGTALMQLHQDGQLDLDEDINNYMPFPVDIPNFESHSITFRMLMTHTASIQDNDAATEAYYSNGDPDISLADAIQRYFAVEGADYDPSANFSNNAPGSAYEYSNMGIALAGYLVEVVSGMPFDEFCNTRIFDPLCMNNTSWYLADFDTARVARPYEWTGAQYHPFPHYGFADYPNGQLRSTVQDLANFAIAFLQNGSFHNQQILNSNAVNQMLSPQVPGLEPTQGLTWYTEEIFLSDGGTVDMWGHNGGESGVSTDLYINPENGIGVAVLSNSEGDNLFVVDELYDYALGLSASGIGNPSCDPLTTSSQYITEPRGIKVFPIPSSGQVTIESSKEVIREFILFNALGQEIQRKAVVQQKTNLYLGKQGVYFILLGNDKGEYFRKKIVITP